jgi:hypothetical protein
MCYPGVVRHDLDSEQFRSAPKDLAILVDRPGRVRVLADRRNKHGLAAWPLAARARQRPLPNRLTKCLIAAALMLPVPNAYSETQAARHMITTAAAIALYKMHCRGKIPDLHRPSSPPKRASPTARLQSLLDKTWGNVI